MMQATQTQRTSGEALRWAAALLTAAAAAIHFAVTPEHFDEDWVFGVFFASAAWAQILWALLVVRSDARRLLVAGIAGNLAIALVWAASRTTGLPLGPEPGAREPVEFIDLLATILEIFAAVVGVIVMRVRNRVIPQRSAIAAVVALAIVVVPLTAAAIATDAGSVHENENGRTHEQPPTHD